MTRDLARLANEPFDAVVVGGGVYGLATAWDLASRGVRVALIDRGDFAAATSFNSLKTIHGGIRALQHGAIRDMREFVRERRALATIAPQLVRPLPFVVPTYATPIRNRTVMRAFLAAYDRLSADRNDGVPPSLALPPGRIVSRDECLRLNPAIDPAGVTGGALWHDYQLHSPERLAIGLLQSTASAGGAAANYVAATSLLTRDGRAAGVRARDALTGAEFDIRATAVVNAAGPWAWPLLERSAQARLMPRPAMSLAMNLVVDRPAADAAAGGLVDGRFLFVVPWRDRSIVGTSHVAFADAPDALVVREAHVETLLREARVAFPRASLTRDRVRLAHRGLLPAVSGRSDGALLKRSIVRDHQADGVAGLITVIGVRYTTARATAEAAADRVLAALGTPPRPSRTATTPLTITVQAAADDTRAAILHAVRAEMALHLTDALLRRTAIGAGGHPGDAVVRDAASVMAAECRWTSDRVAQEIAAVDAFYRIEP